MAYYTTNTMLTICKNKIWETLNTKPFLKQINSTPRSSSPTELRRKEWSSTNRKSNKWKTKDITLITSNYQDRNRIDKWKLLLTFQMKCRIFNVRISTNQRARESIKSCLISSFIEGAINQQLVRRQELDSIHPCPITKSELFVSQLKMNSPGTWPTEQLAAQS